MCVNMYTCMYVTVEAAGKPWVLALTCYLTCPIFDRGLCLGMEACWLEQTDWAVHPRNLPVSNSLSLELETYPVIHDVLHGLCVLNTSLHQCMVNILSNKIMSKTNLWKLLQSIQEAEGNHQTGQCWSLGVHKNGFWNPTHKPSLS